MMNNNIYIYIYQLMMLQTLLKRLSLLFISKPSTFQDTNLKDVGVLCIPPVAAAIAAAKHLQQIIKVS